jgi:hypothetical protein
MWAFEENGQAIKLLDKKCECGVVLQKELSMQFR